MPIPIIFTAKNYLTRQDLESHIISTVGSDSEKNKTASHEIRGTKSELEKLQLSDETAVWGVKCVMLYNSTEKQLKEKLLRQGKEWK